jgi:phosphomannomutase
MIRSNVNCPTNFKNKVVEVIYKKMKKKYKVDTLDGVKIVDKDWWVLIRPSNTQPQIRIIVESKSHSKTKELEVHFRNMIKTIVRLCK